MRQIDPNQARLFLQNHQRAGNKVDEKLMEEVGRGGGLYLLRLEDQEGFLSLIWYEGPGVRLLVPRGEPRTLRDVAQRLRQRGDSFEALSNNLGLSGDEHDPNFFKPCVPIDSCFDFRKFGWVAIVAATDDERTQSPIGSFYIYDGLHKTLVLATHLLAGKTTYQPIEALYLIQRRE